MLRNSLKILHITKSDFFKLNCRHSNQYIWQHFRRSDLKSVWVRLPCCSFKGTVKRHFFGIYLTTLLEVRNLGNTLVMSGIFFLNMFKFNLDLKNSSKNSEKVSSFCDNCI